MISDGHFRKLTADEASQEPDNVWYVRVVSSAARWHFDRDRVRAPEQYSYL